MASGQGKMGLKVEGSVQLSDLRGAATSGAQAGSSADIHLTRHAFLNQIPLKCGFQWGTTQGPLTRTGFFIKWVRKSDSVGAVLSEEH